MTLQRPIVLATVVAALALSAGLHDGHMWGDDFAQYILHARNLVRGAPYDDTGHLYGIGANLGPRSYPPLFPMALAPVYWFAGLNFIAFKTINIVAIVAALLLWAALVRPLLGTWLTTLFVLLVGLHPLTRELVDHVLSDALFVPLVGATLLGIDRWAGRDDRRHAYWRGALTGLLIGLAAMIRFVGFVLLPIAPLIEWRRTGRVSRFTAAAIATSVIAAAISIAAVPGQLTYVEQLGHPLPLRLLRWAQLYGADALALLPGVSVLTGHGMLAAARNVAGYPTHIEGISPADPVAIAMVALPVAITLIGLLTRRSPGAVDWFAMAYVSALLVHPDYAGARLTWQLLPPVILYFLLGLRAVEERLNRRGVAVITGAVAVAAMVILVPVPAYVPTVFDPGPQKLFAFMRERTPPDAVVVFPKPRAMYLFANRRGVAAGAVSFDELERIIARSGATYLIAAPIERDHVGEYANAHPEKHERVYSSGGFEVFAAR